MPCPEARKAGQFRCHPDCPVHGFPAVSRRDVQCPFQTRENTLSSLVSQSHASIAVCLAEQTKNARDAIAGHTTKAVRFPRHFRPHCTSSQGKLSPIHHYGRDSSSPVTLTPPPTNRRPRHARPFPCPWIALPGGRKQHATFVASGLPMSLCIFQVHPTHGKKHAFPSGVSTPLKVACPPWTRYSPTRLHRQRTARKQPGTHAQCGRDGHSITQ